MKVIYLYHSGFIVELDEMVLLFDYYKGQIPKYPKEKKIYVFASHKHKDHFDLAIFKLCDYYTNIHFFLGSDVRLGDRFLERNHINLNVKKYITNIGKNKRIIYDELEIETLRSTDAGVAFMVHAENRDIYHGGDLNWWHWQGESSLFNENMERDYKKEINSITGRHFDIAFVPLDPRQENWYLLGMDYFRKKVQADYIFPMHMWDNYEWITKYKNKDANKGGAGNVMSIKYPGEEFAVWNT